MVAVIIISVLGAIIVILCGIGHALHEDLRFYKTHYNLIRKEYFQLRRQQVVKQHVEDWEKKQREIINKHNDDLK